jgi:hypothetical protein
MPKITAATAEVIPVAADDTYAQVETTDNDYEF